MNWEDVLKEVSPAGYVFVKRVLERSEDIFNDLPMSGRDFQISFSGDEIIVTPATLAVIAAIGEISAEMFGQICEDCSFPNPRFAKFCMNCGSKLTE